MRLAVFDRGNKNLKVVFFDEEKIVHRFVLEGRVAMDEVDKLVNDFDADYAAASSVLPEWSKEAASFFKRRGIGFFEVKGTISLPFKLLITNRENVGADRLSAAAGAFHIGFKEAVLVDAGTAVTIDLVTERGFEGGAIIPGLELMRESLAKGTAMIGTTSQEVMKADPPGKDTAQAVASGTFWALVSAINKLVALESEAARQDLPVLLTGGGAESIRGYLDFEAVFEPDLVPFGVYKLFQLNT